MIGIGVNIRPFISKVARAVADYYNRVIADSGVSESLDCVNTEMSNIDGINLLDQASLVMIPSGYKGGKLYAEIPTNGNGDLTWTRGSDGFRTNASGLIQRVPWNLLQYSEQFDNAYWTKNVGATITANSTTAPDGTTTADTLNVIASTFSGIYRAISGASANYTISIYAKKNTKNWLYLFDVNGSLVRAWFNLDSGVVGTVASGYTATITNVGNGWYRCTLTNNTAISASYYQFGLSDADNSSTPTSSGSAFIWGAQLVEGTTAQTYLPTTDRLNFPRLSYMYGSCPAVLLEPQRTNLALYSDDFTGANWTKTNTTITANTTTSPDGTTNADKIVETATTSTHFVIQNISTTLGVTYNISFYGKASERGVIQWNNQVNTDFVNFDLVNGVVGSSTGITNQQIQSVGNGWYRCSFNYLSPTTGTTGFLRLCIVTSASASRLESYVGNGTNGLFIWGCQFEVGAYPTTYISTTSATATRVADSFSRDNIFTNGLITSSGGTWFVSLLNNVLVTRDSSDVGLFIGNSSNGVSGDVLAIRNNGTARLAITKRIAGSQTLLFDTTTDTVKVAIKWDGTNADVFVNGTKVVSATAFATTNMEFFNGKGNDVAKYISQMDLFPTPLEDVDCEVMTGTSYDSYSTMATALGYTII
jgi:hypothetical protein